LTIFFRSALNAVQAPAFTFILLNYLLLALLLYVLLRDGKVAPVAALFLQCGADVYAAVCCVYHLRPQHQIPRPGADPR
jgi:hypothetical protein